MFTVATALCAHAQQVGIKTNLLYWATTTPNIAIETALGPKLTLEISLAYNPWTFDTAEQVKRIQHWVIMPEFRWWLAERYDGHFLGFHAFAGSYNAGGVKLPLGIFSQLETNRYEGYAAGVGISYGYQWYLGANWNLEATVALGYSYLNYDQYACQRCGDYAGHRSKHYFGPTKAGLSLVYLFKSKNKRHQNY